MFLDDRRNVAHQDTAYRPEQRTIGCIALHFLAHNREYMPRKDTAAVLDEVPRPDMRHLAVHILEILVRHRNPLGFAGGTRSGGIHIRFTRKKHIFLTMLVALHVGAQCLKTVVYGDILPIEAKQVVCIRGRENYIEMMFFAIYCITRDIENVAQCFLSSVARMPAPKPQTHHLASAHQTQHCVD